MHEHPSILLEVARQRQQDFLMEAKANQLARAAGRERTAFRPFASLGALARSASGAIAGVTRRDRVVPQRPGLHPTG